MKLNQLITNDDWKNIGTLLFDIHHAEIKSAVMTQLYYMHGDREVRPTFKNANDINVYVDAFMTTNKQKLIYLFSTSLEDFLSNDNTTTANTTDESNAFNTDYYGGEGKTGKDTSSAETRTTNKSVNNKDKVRNFYDVSNNYLFRMMMNIICETFTIDEEIRW